MFRFLAVCIGISILTGLAPAQLEQLEKKLGLGTTSKLSDSKVTSGLKEALRIGTENSVKLTGKTDGYFKNEAIKILLPGKLHSLETGLRAIGFGPKIDSFVLSMNRSAEAAAPAARKIFTDAILEMSFDDARNILSGGDTAATDYFKGKTTPRLTAAFQPVVEKTMNENGVVKQYEGLAEEYQSIPFAKNQTFDVNKYVVEKALDGLFYELADQERQIRKNPAKRTTALLQEVFGSMRK
jgi:hypothetical protein